MFPKHQPSALCWTPFKLRGGDSFPHRATDTTAQKVLEGVLWLSLEEAPVRKASLVVLIGECSPHPWNPKMSLMKLWDCLFPPRLSRSHKREGSQSMRKICFP